MIKIPITKVDQANCIGDEENSRNNPNQIKQNKKLSYNEACEGVNFYLKKSLKHYIKKSLIELNNISHHQMK